MIDSIASYGDWIKALTSSDEEEDEGDDDMDIAQMTAEQKAEVEKLVNEWIKEGIAVSKKMTTVEEAKAEGAMALFGAKYGDQVSLYTIGDVSKEICCGPHVENTSELGSFKIQKEQSSSAGVRRIKAVIGAKAE